MIHDSGLLFGPPSTSLTIINSQLPECNPLWTIAEWMWMSTEIFWPQNSLLSKMFDVNDLPEPRFGNWVLKAEWLSDLWNNTYVFQRFFIVFARSKIYVFWVAAHVFSNIGV